MIPSSGCPPWPPDHPRTLPRTGNLTPPHGTRPIDGVFGAKTETAVKAFQKAREIPVDGIVGRVTWINIDEADQSEPVLRLGSTGLPVRRLQSRMSAVGFLQLNDRTPTILRSRRVGR